MGWERAFLFMLVGVLGLSESEFVDTLIKCKLGDNECHKDFMQKILKDIGNKGVEELNILPIDPIDISNLTVSILDVIDLKLLEGTAKGIKNCVVNNFEVDLEKKVILANITCDIIAKFKYSVQSDSPIIQTLLGGKIHGDGNGKAKIEQILLNILLPFKIVKREDDTYLIGNFKKLKFTFDILGKLVLAADQLYVGNKESSKEVIGLLNENWRLLVNTFGEAVFKAAVHLVFEFLRILFNKVPTKYYISDDLSVYV